MKTSSINRSLVFWVAFSCICLKGFAGSLAAFSDSTQHPPFSMTVVFVDFQTRSGNQGNQINWSTILEANLSHYEIERSNSGQSFQKIGTIKATGTSSLTVSYTFTDKTPVQGTNIYRLKMVDTRGGTKISEHKLVNGNTQVWVSAPQMIYPNPARAGAAIRVNVAESGTYQLRLVSLQGKLLYSGNYENTDGQGFSVAIPGGASSGVYILDLVSVTNGHRATHKIVIQ